MITTGSVVITLFLSLQGLLSIVGICRIAMSGIIYSDNPIIFLMGTLLLFLVGSIAVVMGRLRKSQQRVKQLERYFDSNEFRLSTTIESELSKSNTSQSKILSENPTREKYLQHFLGKGRHVLFAFTPQFAIKYVSPSVLNVSGHESTEYLQDPELWLKQIHPDCLSELKHGMSELANAQRNEFLMELMIKHADGGWRWILTDQILITDEFGKPVEIVGSCMDINHTKEAELAAQKLNKELEQYKMALNMSRVVTIADKHGVIKYVNPLFEKLSKYSAVEVIGKTHSVVNSHTHSKEFWQRMWTSILDGEMWMGDVLNKAKDGSNYWLNNTIVPIRNIHGEIEEFISIGMDITDKKNNEKQLELLSWAAQQGSSYKLITDAQCRIVWVNSSFERFTGFAYKEIIGKKPEEILHGPDTDQKTIAYLEEKIAEVKGFSCEIQYYTKHGEKFWALANMEPIRNEQGDVTNFFCVLSNISEQKWMIENLDRAKRKAEESEKLKSAFLANMSHEIRTPMNAIMGFAELLNKPNLSQEKRIDFANLIRKRSQDLLNILNDVLDVSKIESGQMTATPTVGNVQKLLDQFLFSVTAEASHLQGKSVRVKMSNELHGEENIIVTDFIRLHQILNNLINNALKFTSEGTIEFGCVRNDANTLLFFVKDTGIGISRDKLEVIFKPFQQANTSIHQKYGGTGLGLAIIEGLLKLLNGRIWVESELGKGTSFYFTIPFTKAESKNNDIGKEVKSKSTEETFPVLLLDNNAHNVQYVKEILAGTQFELQHVVDPSLVLQETERIHPRALLMDLNLQDEQDITLIKRLRSLSPLTEIIPITSFATSEYKKNLLKLGCKSFLTRPFTSGRLITALQQLIVHKS